MGGVQCDPDTLRAAVNMIISRQTTPRYEVVVMSGPSRLRMRTRLVSALIPSSNGERLGLFSIAYGNQWQEYEKVVRRLVHTYEVPDRVKAFQRSSRIYVSNGTSVSDSLYRHSVAKGAYRDGLPLAIIVAGTATDTLETMVCMYHRGDLTTIEAVEAFRSWFRRKSLRIGSVAW